MFSKRSHILQPKDSGPGGRAAGVSVRHDWHSTAAVAARWGGWRAARRRGLSGAGGRATGVSEKDELKDFREVLAVQATSQQIVQYAAMVKISEAASAELRSFQERLDKEKGGSELASRGATLDQALERARIENKKFLDGLSERQKSGLKEITKKLTKADSDLEQQAKALDQVVADAKAVPQQIAGSAQSLEHALTSFRSQQADLGIGNEHRDCQQGRGVHLRDSAGSEFGQVQ